MTPETAFAFLTRFQALVGSAFLIESDKSDILAARAFNVPLSNLLLFLQECPVIGGIVELEVAKGDSTARLRARQDGWLKVSDEPPHDPVFPEGPEGKERYTSEEILARCASGSVLCTFNKEGWGPGWTGWSEDTFADWVRDSGAFPAAQELLSAGPTTIRLNEWKRNPLDAGFLSFGGLGTVTPAESTPDWPVDAPRWLIRAALCSSSGLAEKLASQMSYLIYAACMRLLAEDYLSRENGDVIVVLDRRSRREQVVARTGTSRTELSASLSELITWVLEQPVRTRLVVARHVVAQEWLTPTTIPNASLIKSKAEVAYSAAIDDQALEALSAQAAFEDHVKVFSDRCRDVTRSLDKVLDETLTKTMTALLALFIASVVSKDVRDWPVLVAAFGVAIYVATNSTLSLKAIEKDLASFEHLTTLALSRRTMVKDTTPQASLQAEIADLRSSIRERRNAFRVLILGIIVIGCLLFLFVEPSKTKNKDGVASTVTATPVTTPSSGPSIVPPIAPNPSATP